MNKNLTRGLLICGGIILASIVDLVYMFYSRSQTGHNFSKAGWNASSLGHGKYNIMKMVKGKSK